MENGVEKSFVYEDQEGVHILVPLQIEELTDLPETPAQFNVPFEAPDEPLA